VIQINMQQLTILNDWLPIDNWIAEALDKSQLSSYTENDLVDCLLFWSTNYSTKGTSTRDSLTKSIEAVRILVSLGIDYHLADLRQNGCEPVRLRDLFKAPFSRLKNLGSNEKLDAILSLECGRTELTDYWKSEKKGHIDSRLYAIVRSRYEDEVNSTVQEKELHIILQRLIKITKIPCQVVSINLDPLERAQLIRTIFAIYVYKFKRPSKLRKTANLGHSSFNNLEPLSQRELNKILLNSSLSERQKNDINRRFIELKYYLNISEDFLLKIFYVNSDTWTEIIHNLQINSSIKESGKNYLENKSNVNDNASIEEEKISYFMSYFLVCEEHEISVIEKKYENEEIVSDLKRFFIEPEVDYTMKNLDSMRGAMPKKDFESFLKTAEKKGFISIKGVGRNKMYSLNKI
jgi:hypothetical protein